MDATYLSTKSYLYIAELRGNMLVFTRAIHCYKRYHYEQANVGYACWCFEAFHASIFKNYFLSHFSFILSFPCIWKHCM